MIYEGDEGLVSSSDLRTRIKHYDQEGPNKTVADIAKDIDIPISDIKVFLSGNNFLSDDIAKKFKYEKLVEFVHLRDAQMWQENIGYVYIVQSEKYYKIGKSTTKIERPIAIIKTIPMEARILRVYRVNDYDKCEALIHSIFRKKRIRGEWFGLIKDDIYQIDKIVGTHPTGIQLEFLDFIGTKDTHQVPIKKSWETWK